METVIQAKQIVKTFKDVKAVKGVDLEVYAGEFLALLGPNGAGKTTLVEMIEGIQKPDSGVIRIMGKTWKGNEQELHKILGISLQETRFIDRLTLRETLLLFASFYGLGKCEVDEIVELIKLKEKQNSFVKNLSGGQRQRLALGIALLNNPKILLLDEPTTGLDPTARRDIWNILLDLRKKHNTALILTTHYMEEAEYLCDRIVVMDSGKILAQGTLDELLTMNQCSEIIEFSYPPEQESIHLPDSENILGIYKEKRTNTCILKIKNSTETIYDVLQEFKKHAFVPKTFECRRMTLDDLFLTLTGRNLSEE